MKSNTTKAFTLVEMLVVIIIIGILAVALIPRLTAIQGRARDVARKGDLQQLAVWLASYQLSNTTYPSGSGAISQSLPWLSPLYLRSLPRDPYGSTITTTNWSQGAVWEYLYISLESNKAYVLISVNEWGWINANWISHSTSTSMTWSLPGLIAPTAQVDIINKSLCTSMSNGLLSRTGNICTADYKAYQAKYIIASK